MKTKDMKKMVGMAVLVIFSILLLTVLPLGHDLWYHIYRIGAMATELENNPWKLPIRMLSESYNGYGYGAALYYGDFFLYIPALLVHLGLDEVLAYKIFTVLILWGTFGIAYYSARIMDKDKELATMFAVFYAFSSSSMLNLCIRSAIGESLALAFLPLVVASFWGMLYKKQRSRSWLILSLSMSAIALSHMLTLALITVVLCVWCLLEVKRVFVQGKWLEIIKAAVAMIGLSASFLFPMFEQMLFQKVQTPGNNEYQKKAFLEYSVEWMDYFIPYEVKKIMVSVFSLSWNIETWHPGTIGLFTLVLVVAILLLKPMWNKKQKLVAMISVIALLLLGIMPVMNVVKEFLAFMQFPWRVLPIIMLGLSFVGIWIVENNMCNNKKLSIVKWCMLIATILIAFWAIGPRYVYQIYVQRDNYSYIQENNPEFYHKYLIKYDKNAGDALYLPQGVSLELYIDRGETVISNREDIKYEWNRDRNVLHIRVSENPYEDTALELPLYMYKGYVAENEQGRKLPISKSKNGLVTVEIGNDIGEIMVWYGGTTLQKLSDIITSITIVALCMLLFHKIKNKEYYKDVI